MRLTKYQRKAISFLGKSSLAKKFYWTGGTLLAYRYLKHRKSLDLDFFTHQDFHFEETNEWAQHFKEKAGFAKISYKKVFSRWEFLFENKESLRLEFAYYNHEKKTLGRRKKLLGVYVDSLEDIAANKTFAYFDRNEPKDLFDIYFLLTKAKFTPKKLLELVKQKFGVSFSEDLFWSEAFKALPLLQRVKPLMKERKAEDKERLLKKIKNYFENHSRTYLQKVFSKEN